MLLVTHSSFVKKCSIQLRNRMILENSVEINRN
jgi:hypothetical protein